MSALARRLRVSFWHLFLLLATTAFAADFVVTNTNDSGPGSLREAVRNATFSLLGNETTSGTDARVIFDIPGDGPHLITLTNGSIDTTFNGDAYEYDPSIYLKTIEIDGTTDPGVVIAAGGAGDHAFLFGTQTYLHGLTFSGFDATIAWHPAFVSRMQNRRLATNSTSASVIANNYFNTPAPGTESVFPASNGTYAHISSADSLLIGGASFAAANYFANANRAVDVGNLSPVTVAYNYFGLDAGGNATGTLQYGVRADDDAVVEGNVFTGASQAAVYTPLGIEITQNSMYGNDAGIVNGPSADAQLPPPVLTSAYTSAGSTTIQGTLTAEANSTWRIELFTNPVAEQQGRTYLASSDVTVDAGGHGSFTIITAPTTGGHYVNATATNLATSKTSEFSNDLAINSCAIVTANPENESVCAGQTATFTAAAEGAPAPAVQWQVSTDGGDTWNDVPSANSTTLSFTASAADDGNQYRAVFNNSCGNVPTAAATLSSPAPTADLQVDWPDYIQPHVPFQVQVHVEGNCQQPTGTVTLYQVNPGSGGAMKVVAHAPIVLDNEALDGSGNATLEGTYDGTQFATFYVEYSGDGTFGSVSSPAVALPGVAAQVPLSREALAFLALALAVVATFVLRRL